MMTQWSGEPNNTDINDADIENSNIWKALPTDSDSKCHDQCYSKFIK
jgi:hypothetical protein